MKKIGLILLLCLCVLPAQAEDLSSGGDYTIKTAGRFKLGLGGDLGFGSKDVVLGTWAYENVANSPTKRIKMSFGDASGCNMLVGYGLTDNLDLDLGVGHKKSGMIGNLKGADGDFKAYEASMALNFRFRPYERLHFKLGGGPVWYFDPKLRRKIEDHDSQGNVISGQANSRVVIDYKDAVGLRINSGMESFFNENYSIDLSLCYQFVEYKYNKVKINGSSVWTDGTPYVPENLAWGDRLRKPDASGVIMGVRVVRYF